MTYQQAKKAASRKNPNIVYSGNAGNGWKFEVYYCPRRGRQVWTSISPEGLRIV